VIGTEPELSRYERVPEGAVLLLASDGLWDALSSAEAAALVHRALRSGDDLAYAARALVLEATQVRVLSCNGSMSMPKRSFSWAAGSNGGSVEILAGVG